MDWRIKAFFQKCLSLTRLGDKLNHIPATLTKDYHYNVVNYQLHESLRKFSLIELDLSQCCCALEIGTGYSLISSVVLYLLGFKKIVTVDVNKDVSFNTLRKQVKYLEEEDFVEKISIHGRLKRKTILEELENIRHCNSLKEVLSYCNMTYLAPYTVELIEKEATTFHYICSQVVFEHIQPEILEILAKKMKIWLGDGCYSVHTVNFIDHFANPGFFQDKKISEFNFLKYSDSYWKYWAGNPIAYTNRLSYLYYLNLFERKGLKVLEFTGENYREKILIDATKIHKDVKSKYKEGVDFSKLTDFQRGTYVLRN